MHYNRISTPFSIPNAHFLTIVTLRTSINNLNL